MANFTTNRWNPRQIQSLALATGNLPLAAGVVCILLTGLEVWIVPAWVRQRVLCRRIRSSREQSLRAPLRKIMRTEPMDLNTSTFYPLFQQDAGCASKPNRGQALLGLCPTYP